MSQPAKVFERDPVSIVEALVAAGGQPWRPSLPPIRRGWTRQ